MGIVSARGQPATQKYSCNSEPLTSAKCTIRDTGQSRHQRMEIYNSSNLCLLSSPLNTKLLQNLYPEPHRHLLNCRPVRVNLRPAPYYKGRHFGLDKLGLLYNFPPKECNWCNQQHGVICEEGLYSELAGMKNTVPIRKYNSR